MPEESAFEEEIKGMEPTLLHGDAKALPKLYEEIVCISFTTER